MFNTLHFGMFVFTVLMINLSPGSTFVAVTSNAITRGTRAGLITAGGAGLGILFYAAISVLCISALVDRSPAVFDFLRYIGAAYLLYCSYRAFTSAGPAIAGVKTKGMGESFRDGLLVNLLNPLTIVFFLTVIPQFVNVTAGNTAAQLSFLGIWVTLSGTIVNMLYALIFGKLGNYFAGKPAFWFWQKMITGLLFLYLAVKFGFAM